MNFRMNHSVRTIFLQTSAWGRIRKIVTPDVSCIYFICSRDRLYITDYLKFINQYLTLRTDPSRTCSWVCLFLSFLPCYIMAEKLQFWPLTVRIELSPVLVHEIYWQFIYILPTKLHCHLTFLAPVIAAKLYLIKFVDLWPRGLTCHPYWLEKNIPPFISILPTSLHYHGTFLSEVMPGKWNF